MSCVCGKSFRHRTSLSRHRRTCEVTAWIKNMDQTKRHIRETNERIDSLQEQNDSLRIQNAELRDHNNELHNESKELLRNYISSLKEDRQRVIDYEDLLKSDKKISMQSQHEHINDYRRRAFDYEEMIKDEIKEKNKLIHNAGHLAEKSISTLQLLTTHMDKAPQLKAITNYTHLITTESDEDYCIGEIITYHFRRGSLHEYIGKIIIEEYKKDNPRDQSIWNSDTSRLTYFIRDIMGEEEDLEWITDKKGHKVKDKIIMPLLNHIREELRNYTHQLMELDDENPDKFNRLRDTSAIIHAIGDKKESSELADRINKFIAGHFYLDRKNTMKLIE